MKSASLDAPLLAFLNRMQPTDHNDVSLRFRYDESQARMAKSADAADLKSAGPKGLWGFKSPSGHHRINYLAIFSSTYGYRSILNCIYWCMLIPGSSTGEA